MGYQFATAALGPLLLAQGRHVRRVTPRLDEAAGPRSGVTGDGPPLRLLVLGDSAAAGVGVATQRDAFTGQLANALAPFRRVSWKLLARTGMTTQDLVDRLAAEPAEAFDAAVTSLGVNDVTAGVPPARWRAAQATLVELLATRFSVEHVILSAVPPMERFPALPQPLRWYLGLRAKRLNAMLAGWAATQPRCTFLPCAVPLEPHLMASDGFHPGAAACASWAAQAAAAVRQRLDG
ncbi:SGNH/GDSL hydrolase family protein [Burkholderia multivorans]|uniref:SGNH/GDSL hydrolase family protein n=1 Tax=Burkholderia ubonensis TaxID=101571 RepID=UPI000F6E06ED|nr:SGNH/GDSL hydrolase family protein [Burkholderia ubonensis]AYZ66900.1 SGNH/GDSL hydrolase family protein [Burkholderia multivorans]VWB29537.1 lipase [Burkholderia ubonensis]